LLFLRLRSLPQPLLDSSLAAAQCDRLLARWTCRDPFRSTGPFSPSPASDSQGSLPLILQRGSPQDFPRSFPAPFPTELFRKSWRQRPLKHSSSSLLLRRRVPAVSAPRVPRVPLDRAILPLCGPGSLEPHPELPCFRGSCNLSFLLFRSFFFQSL